MLTATSRPAAGRTHTIQKGDTYTSLAVKYLGHAKYAKLIEKANPGREATRLYVGAKINIPDAPAPTAATPSTEKKDKASGKIKPDSARSNGKSAREVAPPPDPSRAYVVQPGDSWQGLARKFLGRAEADAELYEWNKERVGGDPNLLRTGLVIELPPRAKLPAKPSTPAAPK